MNLQNQVTVTDVDKIGSATSPLGLSKTVAYVSSSSNPQPGDVVTLKDFRDRPLGSGKPVVHGSQVELRLVAKVSCHEVEVTRAHAHGAVHHELVTGSIPGLHEQFPESRLRQQPPSAIECGDPVEIDRAGDVTRALRSSRSRKLPRAPCVDQRETGIPRNRVIVGPSISMPSRARGVNFPLR